MVNESDNDVNISSDFEALLLKMNYPTREGIFDPVFEPSWGGNSIFIKFMSNGGIHDIPLANYFEEWCEENSVLYIRMPNQTRAFHVDIASFNRAHKMEFEFLEYWN